METSVNNKCKAFTSLEQSKKLAEILPIESADCYLADDISVEFGHGWHPQHFPCWSLTALLNILPSATLDTSNDHYYRLNCRQKFTEWHDNAIDACYEMIIKLHEQNLL